MGVSNLIRWAALGAMVGGALWALTPLREPLLGGELSGHPVFRPYNLVLLVIAVLLACWPCTSAKGGATSAWAWRASS